MIVFIFKLKMVPLSVLKVDRMSFKFIHALLYPHYATLPSNQCIRCDVTLCYLK